MKISILSIGLLLFLLFPSFVIQKEKTFSLTIEVKNLRNSKGIAQFTLYNKEGSIPDKNYERFYKKLTEKIVNGSSTVTFNNLPEGKYAVNLLHDENSNGIIDKG